MIGLGRAPLSARARLLWGAGLCLGTFLLYAKALAFDFIDFDTKTILLGSPHLYDETSLLASARAILFEYFPREEPLIVRDLSWAIDSRIFGFRNPFGYHLGNVLLNAFNSWLVFALLLRFTGRPALAIVSGLLFAVLPVHVQPVCWEMSRKDMLVSFFMLLGLLVNGAAIEHAGTPRGRVLDLSVTLICMLAVLSKFNAVFYPLLLVLHRVMQPYLDGRVAPEARLELRAAARAALPILLPTLAISLVIYHWYRANLTAVGVLGGRGAPALSFEHAQTLSVFVPLSLAKNLKLIFWPFGHSIMYHHPNTNIAPESVDLATAYVVCAALAGSAFHFARRRKDVLFAFLAFGALLLPYLNIEYIGYWVADRYLYLAALPPLVLVVAAGLAIAQRHARVRPLLAVAAAALVLFYAARTFVFEEAYRDNLAMWRHETALPQPSVLAWQALAKETVRRAEHAAAGPERERWAREARHAIARGLALYATMPASESSYRKLERLHASSMHVLLGALAKLERQPVSVELEHYRTAHGIAISTRTALAMADAFMRLAGEAPEHERERLVRESFRYFEKYVQHVRRDSTRHPMLLQLLLQNYGRFAFMEPDAQALVERYLR